MDNTAADYVSMEQGKIIANAREMVAQSDLVMERLSRISNICGMILQKDSVPEVDRFTVLSAMEYTLQNLRDCEGLLYRLGEVLGVKWEGNLGRASKTEVLEQKKSEYPVRDKRRVLR